MKMIFPKFPVPIRINVVLLSFFSFAACSAFYLNSPPATMAVRKAPSAHVVAGSFIGAESPDPAETTLLADLAEMRPASDDVCRDAEALDHIDRLLAAATEAPQPEKEKAPEPEPQETDPPFHRLILQAAVAHDIDPALIKAVILAESNYNPKAVSKRGARGLMQLMPSTAAALGVNDLFDPEDNINGGVKYLRQLLDRFDNDVRLALAAYNAGSRHVRNYNGVPPFRATRIYIKKVFKYQTHFEEEMASRRETV